MTFTIVRKKYLITIWISILVLTSYGQNASQCMSLASRQASIGNHQEAIDLYERVLFFDQSVLRFYAIQNIAAEYSRLNEFEKAVHYMEQARVLAPNDSLLHVAVFELARYYILSENPQFALVELYSLNKNLSLEEKKRRLFLLTSANFNAGLYQEAKKNAEEYLALSGKVSDHYKDLINKAMRINPAAPTWAGISSIIIPGCGQAMSGNFGSAVNSFILITAFDVLFVYILKNYSWFDAYFTVFPWAQRYYTGGFIAARDLMKEHQKEKKQEILKQLLSEIYLAR